MTRSNLTPNGGTRRWRKIRLQVLERDDWTCAFCGGPADQVDHIVRRSDGGTDDLANLRAACRSCNWKAYMLERNPLWPTHCLNGHELTEANTYVRPSDGRRYCRTCKREQHARWLERQGPDWVRARDRR